MTTTAAPSPRRLRGVAVAVSALAVALALAACGTSTGSATGPVKIRVANRASGRLEAKSAAGAAPARATAVDAAIYPYPVRTFTYVVQGTLPELGGEAPAWHYAPVPKVGAAQVAALAKTLGVPGAVTETPLDEGGGWHVGPIDGSARSLTVQRDAAASWYLDGGVQEGSLKAMCGDAVGPPTTVVEPSSGKTVQPVPASPDNPTADAPTAAVPSPGPDAPHAPTPDAPSPEPGAREAPAPEPPTSMPDCPLPEPPTNVPSEDAALAKARTLAASLAASPAAGRMEVFGDEYGRYVTWSTTLGGLANPVTWSAAYGAEGALVSANGSLAVPEKAAPYPRIGTTKAIERLKAGQVGPGGVRVAGSSTTGSGTAVVPAASEAAVLPATTAGGLPPGVRTTAAPDAIARPSTTGAPAPDQVAPSTTGSALAPTTLPAPVTTVSPPAPVEVTITITGVEPIVVALYAVDGDIWLVPGYRFTTSVDVVDVPAIDDAYVEQVTPDDGGLRPDDVGTGRLQPGGPVPTPVVAPPARPVGGPPTT